MKFGRRVEVLMDCMRITKFHFIGLETARDKSPMIQQLGSSLSGYRENIQALAAQIDLRYSGSEVATGYRNQLQTQLAELEKLAENYKK